MAYPVLGLLLGCIAFHAPQRPWRWALAAMFTQALVLFVSNPKGNLLPLGIIVFGILALPLMIATAIGAWLGRRHLST